MKSEFKAKLLQHLLAKRDSEKGFTLIELLVVIIIIGILAAIALPSFLNQANKAKQSEARTYVGSLNKGQQAYFTERNRFGSNINVLGVGLNTDTANYTYESKGAPYDATTATNNTATSTGAAEVVALRGYIGRVNLAVVLDSSDITSLAILCEKKAAGTGAPLAADVVFTQAATKDAAIECKNSLEAVGN
jgi:prepilin-type N-terminal cleavage/methylation domain-containing protein